MWARLQQLRRDERGMSLIFVGMGFMAFFAATTLAIDVGMFMAARSQAQNAADAGALAGATALVFDDFENRSADGPAVQSAINTAVGNLVVGENVSVVPTDVTFPMGSLGIANRVKVTVFRTADRSNPVATLIGPIFGLDSVDILATATAEASPANAMTCVKPFTIPDRWEEVNSPPWTPDSLYERYDLPGSDLLPNPDVYYPPGDENYKGYDATADKGLQLVIREGTGNQISSSFYYSWNMPGGSGGDWYRENIATCNQTIVRLEEIIIQEPGSMVGPTNQGVDDLIALDPTAYWDTTNNRPVSTMNPSPRVAPVPVFDPEYYQSGIVNGRPTTLRVANWIGFFIEGRSGNNVYGRITPVTGIIDGAAGIAPEKSFPKAIRLVQ